MKVTLVISSLVVIYIYSIHSIAIPLNNTGVVTTGRTSVDNFTVNQLERSRRLAIWSFSTSEAEESTSDEDETTTEKTTTTISNDINDEDDVSETAYDGDGDTSSWFGKRTETQTDSVTETETEIITETAGAADEVTTATNIETTENVIYDKIAIITSSPGDENDNGNSEMRETTTTKDTSETINYQEKHSTIQIEDSTELSITSEAITEHGRDEEDEGETSKNNNENESTTSSSHLVESTTSEFKSEESSATDDVSTSETLIETESEVVTSASETFVSTDENEESTTLISRTSYYEEECEAGYEYKPGQDCVDINECERGSHLCEDERYTCVNLKGTYKCELKAEVPDESTKASSLGANNDESLSSTNDDDTNEFCKTCQHICSKDADERHSCLCYHGYQLKDDLITCIDLDECAEQLHNCTENTICVNREGSYDCFEPQIDESPSIYSCEDGYQMVDGSCKDECSIRNNQCSLDEICAINNDSIYTCTKVTCPQNQKVNLKSPTEYQCICNDGLHLDSNGNCEDIDECILAPSNPCGNGTCINTFSSYECTCPPGYELIDGLCLDINECFEGTHKCKTYSQCINDIGSHHCQCPDGYEWSNDTCHYVLPDISCLPGFKLSKINNNCEDIDECSSNEDDICSSIEGSTCLNTNGSYSCICQFGYTVNNQNNKCISIETFSLPHNDDIVVVAEIYPQQKQQVNCAQMPKIMIFPLIILFFLFRLNNI